MIQVNSLTNRLAYCVTDKKSQPSKTETSTMSETMEMESKPTTARIPRSAEDDYTPDMTEKRRAFIAERSGASLRHTAQYSFDPKLLPGNLVDHTTVVNRRHLRRRHEFADAAGMSRNARMLWRR